MIRLTPAGAITATAFPLTYEIVEKLTRSYCANAVQQPAISTAFSVADTQLVGSVMYATIQAIITVTYQPKHSRNMQTNTFSESFVVSFPGATSASTIAATGTAGYNEPAYSSCSCCNTAQGVKAVGFVNVAFTANA